MNAKMLSIIAIVLWVASAGFIGFKFVTGSTVTGADGREAIVLLPSERNLILSEMRGMLVAVQEIITAANEGDMAAVKEITHRVGLAEVGAVPAELMLKLPILFKRLGRATHAGFDEVGLAADMDSEAVLESLADNMTKCIACHESYLLTE